MRIPSGRRLSAIGLDLSGSEARAVQLCRGRGGAWGWFAGGVIGTGEPREWSAADAWRVVDYLERQGCVGPRVVVALPARAQVCVGLRLPGREAGAAAGEIARAQVADAARCAAGELEVAWWEGPTRAGENERAGLAVALRRVEIEAVVGPIEEAGWRVEAIDARSTALARAVGPMLATGERAAVLELSDDAAELTLVEAERGVVFQRGLADGNLRTLQERLSARLGLERAEVRAVWRGLGLVKEGEGARLRVVREQVAVHAERLGADVRASLAYAGGGRGAAMPVTRLVIVGEGVVVGGLVDGLGRALGVQAQGATLEAVGIGGAQGPAAWAGVLASALARHAEARREVAA